MSTQPIDLSAASPQEFRGRLGELVQISLQRSGACVLVARGIQEVSILNPGILDAVPDEDIAAALLEVWTDEEVLRYLEQRAERRKGGRHG